MSQDDSNTAKRNPALYIPTEEDYSSPAKALSIAILVTIAFVTAACLIALSI